MNPRKILHHLLPHSIVEKIQLFKKRKRNARIQEQKKRAEGLSKEQLVQLLTAIGIDKGDVLLVHSSLSKIGYLEEGPKSLVDALFEVLGENGHLLMPTSPNNQLQLDYVKNLEVFDALNSPSKLGVITEYFRKLPDVKRSLHPTEPVSCWGKNKNYFVDGHFKQLSPYNENSPFYKVVQENGKILMIGVSFDNAGTNLHCLEDALDFKFPIYLDEIFELKVRDEQGNEHFVKTKVHNPEWSKKRKCDDLIPLFEERKALRKVKIGDAPSLLIDAKKMFDTMVEEYKSKGVTMYTPKGSN